MSKSSREGIKFLRGAHTRTTGSIVVCAWREGVSFKVFSKYKVLVEQTTMYETCLLNRSQLRLRHGIIADTFGAQKTAQPRVTHKVTQVSFPYQ